MSAMTRLEGSLRRLAPVRTRRPFLNVSARAARRWRDGDGGAGDARAGGSMPSIAAMPRRSAGVRDAFATAAGVREVEM